MSEEFKYRIRKDSDGCFSEIDIRFPGFLDSFAYPTGDATSSYWEFDLCTHDGLSGHFQIPYTTSSDLLETLFIRCIRQLGLPSTS